jgi:hypothetical protein
MKNLIKYGFIAVVSCFFTACGESDFKTEKNGHIYTFNTIEVDECEYLVSSSKFTHKGNCKNPIHKCNCN